MRRQEVGRALIVQDAARHFGIAAVAAVAAGAKSLRRDGSAEIRQIVRPDRDMTAIARFFRVGLDAGDRID